MKRFKWRLTIIMALVLTGSILVYGYGMNLKTALVCIDDQSSRLRCRAAYCLGESGDPACVEALIEILSDPDRHVRRIAAHSLGKLNDSRAVTPLVTLLEDRSQPTCVRCSAAGALGRIGDRRAGKTLAQTVDKENGWLRRIAAESLAKLESRPTFARIM